MHHLKLFCCSNDMNHSCRNDLKSSAKNADEDNVGNLMLKVQKFAKVWFKNGCIVGWVS